ncbi:MAG: hypothetical protein P8Y42_20110, partial [Exilibacterium sp.]
MEQLMPNEQSEHVYLAAYNIHEYDMPLSTVDTAIFTVRTENLALSDHPNFTNINLRVNCCSGKEKIMNNIL